MQVTYGRAQRTHAGFAERHGLPARTFEPSAAGRAGQDARSLLDAAVEAIGEADHLLVEIQDSMMPVEVGDAELRAGLAGLRELVGPLPDRARRWSVASAGKVAPMASWTRVIAPDVEELPVFAHAAIAGDQIYVSGMLGLSDDFSAVVEGGIGPETKQAFRHVEKILAACDATLADIVKVSASCPTSASGRR